MRVRAFVKSDTWIKDKLRHRLVYVLKQVAQRKGAKRKGRNG